MSEIRYYQHPEWPFPTPEPGVYLNMSFDEYLSIQALSNSGIKDLLVSGPNFWANSWLNPFRKRTDKKHHVHGRAYHKRILEKREAFDLAYAPDFEDDPNDTRVLRSTDQIEARLRELGVKGWSGKPKAYLTACLLNADPSARTVETLAQKYRDRFPGREFLHPDLIREIEISCKAIESNPYLNQWLVGGYPEVTIVWWSEEHRCMFKIRWDYLKIGAGADLKTIANEKGREFEKAVDYAIAGNKYIIQPALYIPGANAARGLIRAGKVYGAENIRPGWLDLYAETPVEEFRFIFQQKDLALCTEGRIYSVENTELHTQGSLRIAKGVETFHKNWKEFGDSIWFSMKPAQHINYASLPSFINDL